MVVLLLLSRYDMKHACFETWHQLRRSIFQKSNSKTLNVSIVNFGLFILLTTLASASKDMKSDRYYVRLLILIRINKGCLTV